MTNFLLPCYNNTDRPDVNHASVTELPIDILGSDISAQILASLKVSSTAAPICAASGRLWENLLEKYRVPYLLLRVADMRMTLGSKATALPLYEELQKDLHDAQLQEWIDRSRVAVTQELENQLLIYKNVSEFAPSQRWRPTAGVDPFPYCKLQRAQIESMRDQWAGMGFTENILDKFLNLHCLETNAIEGTMHFSTSASTKLIQLGFYNQVSPIDDADITGGEIRDRNEALLVLRDTHNAANEVFSLLGPSPVHLTTELVCKIHKVLMQTSQVLCLQTRGGRRLAHLNVGVTRQSSCSNVTASMRNGKKIQFCPYDEVDEELSAFCERFNELLQKEDMDPFAASAWISHVFVTVHPFEDGNGRLSRILASVPLLKKNLPPLCIPHFFKDAYIALGNDMRASRDGDYRPLMETFYHSTNAALHALKVLVTSESAKEI